jgi:hypothetical protein
MNGSDLHGGKRLTAGDEGGRQGYFRERGDPRSQLTVHRIAASITRERVRGMSVPKLGMSRLRNVFCWTMIAVLPVSSSASGTGGGMLYGKGTIWLNNDPLARPSAIFPGDVIVTQAGAVANIITAGSNVIIQPDTIIKYENNALELEHGTVSVATASGMKVHVGCIETAPAAVNDWTEFEVNDVNGTVHIFAHKLDVNVSESVRPAGKLASAAQSKPGDARHVTVPQGQTTDRDEHCQPDNARGAAHQIITDKQLMDAGLGVATGLGLWLILRGDDPVSPSQPCQNPPTCN